EHWLSNDVYRAIRAGWKRHETRFGPRAPTIIGASSIGVPGDPQTLIRYEAALGISEANPGMGIPHPHAVLVDKEIHDALEYEVTPREWDDWLDALHADTARRTLWLLKVRNG